MGTVLYQNVVTTCSFSSSPNGLKSCLLAVGSAPSCTINVILTGWASF